MMRMVWTATAFALLIGTDAPAQNLELHWRYCTPQIDRIHPEVVMDACNAIADAAAETLENRTRALINRGNAQISLGDLEGALRDYDRAVKLNPNSAVAHNARGLASADLGLPDEAMADFDRAIALDATLVNAWHNRGNMLYLQADIGGAIASYDRALTLDPKDVASLTNRAIALEESDAYDRALADLNRLAEVNGNDPEVYFSRGRILFLLGRFDAAADDLKRLPQFGPVAPYTAIWIHLAFARAGQAAEGRLAERVEGVDLSQWPGAVIAHLLDRQTLDQLLAAARDPDPERQRGQLCEAYFYAGQTALLRGDRAEAERLLRLAVASDLPGFNEHRGARAELARLSAR